MCRVHTCDATPCGNGYSQISACLPEGGSVISRAQLRASRTARTCCCRGYLALEAGALDAVDRLSLA